MVYSVVLSEIASQNIQEALDYFTIFTSKKVARLFYHFYL
jgi:hypothetical protein